MVISHADMNAILITILARPYLRCIDAGISICLPGIAGDGYLKFTVKYLTPNLGIVFATLDPNTFFECLGKANIIAAELQRLNLVTEVHKAIEQNYLVKTPIAPSGKCFLFCRAWQ